MSTERTSIFSRFAAIFLAACMLVSLAAAGACAKDRTIRVPDGLTREEAALYVALAAVCPVGDNNTKAEFLTFRFEGWSFEDIPEAIGKYITDYCVSGKAALLQFDDAVLEEMGYIKKGDGGFYGTDENVYAEGKGKIFTFTLPEDQDTAADSVKVNVKSYKSDRDTSGFSVELKFEGGNWKFDKTTDAWNQYQFFTPDPGTDHQKDPQK